MDRLGDRHTGPTDDRPDPALLRAHLAGDPQAFAVLLGRHRDRLWALALRTMRHPQDAEDALQDGLIAAVRGAASFRGDSAVSTWLHRVVMNACLDRLRRLKVRRADALGERDLPDRRDESEQAVARLDVHAALATLPESQRLAIVLVDLEGLPVAEAAELLGVPVGTVKSRCARGRLALADVLGTAEREPPPGPRRPTSGTAQGVQDGPGAGGGSR